MSHRIILLNFSERVAQTVAKAGFNVERGFLGKYETQEYLPSQTPRPLYEYDVLVYDSNVTRELEKEFSSPINLLSEQGSFRTLGKFNGPPHIRIAFIGESAGLTKLTHAGLPFIHLSKAEQSVSSFVEVRTAQTFEIVELHKLLAA